MGRTARAEVNRSIWCGGSPGWLRAAVAVLVLSPGGVAWAATFASLAERLPAATNAIVAVNVEKVLDSPIAKEEQWRQNLIDSWEKQPLMIPPDAVRVLSAAYVKTSTMESYWEMSLIEMERMPSVAELAKAQGGYVDRVWDKEAVCAPINAYFVPLERRVLASVTPADRSEIVRWVRQPVKPEGNVTSAYIKEVVAGLGEKSDIVMAMDLEGAFGVPLIRRFLANSEVKEFGTPDVDAVARLLGTMKGITLAVRVEKEISGRVTVHLGDKASLLGAAGKPLMLGALSSAGMRLDDLRDWTFVTSGNEVRGEGKLTRAALRRLLGLVQSPVPAAPTVANAAAAKLAADRQPSADPAVASQRYYKAICASLDQLGAGASAADMAVWIRNTARRIDQLPILNVDPALVEWGAMVGAKLKQAGGIAGVGQTQMNARVAGVQDPDFGSYGYDSNGYYWSSGYNDAQVENARRQRRQVALEQKAQAQEQVMTVLAAIAETRPKIRAQMVEKYRVEF